MPALKTKLRPKEKPQRQATRSNGRAITSVPNRPDRPALGTARLWESGFPKSMLGQAWVTCRFQVFEP